MPEQIRNNLEKIQEKKVVLTPEQEKVRQEMIYLIQSSDISSILKAIEISQSLPLDSLKDQDVLEAAYKNINSILEKSPGYVYNALKIKKFLGADFNAECLNTKRIVNDIIKYLSTNRDAYYDCELILLIAKEFLSNKIIDDNKKEIEQAVIKYINNIFSNEPGELIFRGYSEETRPINSVIEISKSMLGQSAFTNEDILKKILDLYNYCLQQLLRKIEIPYSSRREYVERWNQYLDQLKQLKVISNDSILNIAQSNNFSYSLRQKAFDVLVGLTENGETAITEEFAKIIQQRGKQKEISQEIAESKWGLDPVQESAFYTLIRLDNPDSNSALFSLLDNDNVHSTVKYAALKKLSSKKRGFLDENNKETLRSWLKSKSSKELDWQDLRFIKSILNDIPSKELRDKSRQYIAKPMEYFKNQEQGINQTWLEKYNNIPEHTFLQVWQFSNGDEELLEKFQNIYSLIRKDNSKKENLLYGIINSLEINPQILKLLAEKLKDIDFKSKQDVDELSDFLRATVFLNKIEDISKSRGSYDEEDYDEDYEYEDEKQDKEKKESKINLEIKDIFSKKINNLQELNVLFQEITTKKIQEILPHKDITAEKIKSIEQQWGDMEPIFTYLGRYSSLKKYIAEIVSSIDAEENWKNWRYDLKNKTVKKQIRHLSESQFELWKQDYFTEIGDIMVAESATDKPKQIKDILFDAILVHKHIYNPEFDKNDKNKFIQQTLELAFKEINQHPEKQEEIVQKYTQDILQDTDQIDAIIQTNNIPKIEQILKDTFSQDKEIQLTAKTKNSITFIQTFLPEELSKQLAENYRFAEKTGKAISNNIITPEIEQAINERIKNIQNKLEDILKNSDIFEKHQLDKKNLENLGQFYQKRQELKSIVDILRLSNLSSKLITINRIIEKQGKKGGQTILNTIENLKKYFKNSAIEQDLKNIEFSLKEKQEIKEKRRLAMILTDNAQMLWQAGKYPLGNGSCQHYAEGSYARQLMGYVGDANCKVAYLIDLNKLSQSIKQELEEKEFEEIKDQIPAQELLNASIARSIIKITKDKDNFPVILLEPTYSSVNKGDLNMDRYFNLFIDLMIAEPGKMKMARAGGKESVSKAPSRSPGGQYEDLNLSEVKFIHKLSKPTKEDEEIMERIRSSH